MISLSPTTGRCRLTSSVFLQRQLAPSRALWGAQGRDGGGRCRGGHPDSLSSPPRVSDLPPLWLWPLLPIMRTCLPGAWLVKLH